MKRAERLAARALRAGVWFVVLLSVTVIIRSFSLALTAGSQLWAWRSHTYVGGLVPDSLTMPGLLPLPVWDVSARRADTVRLNEGIVLMLVYDPECWPCRVNMPSWLRLIAAARRHGVTPVAISLRSKADTTAGPESYWRFGRGFIRRVVPASDSLLRVRGLYPGTPATVLIRDGELVGYFLGALSGWQESWLLRSLGST